jgi:hypothetical protein
MAQAIPAGASGDHANIVLGYRWMEHHFFSSLRPHARIGI